MTRLALALTALLIVAATLRAADVRVLNDFEADTDLRGWELKEKSATLVDNHVTHGKRSLRAALGEFMVNLSKQDWSGFCPSAAPRSSRYQEPLWKMPASSVRPWNVPWCARRH